MYGMCILSSLEVGGVVPVSDPLMHEKYTDWSQPSDLQAEEW